MHTTSEKIVKSVLGLGSKSTVEDISEIICVDRFIGDDLMRQICRMLTEGQVKNLTKMVLRGNNIGSAGVQALSAFLARNKSLQHLSLEWNHIGAMGCKYLADAISKDSNPDLQLSFLDLRNNNIDSEGAMHLAEALKSNTTITTLDLRWNK
eukprot:gene39231-53035_t